MTTLVKLVELLVETGRSPSPEGGGLTGLDHGLQCAALLLALRPEDEALQLAGLVHDLGHRFGPDAEHGRRGAEFVRPVLGDRVADLVDAHVPAKRFLVATEPGYRAALSDDSTRTLVVQGNAMTPDEVERFRSHPSFDDALELRRADEAAKVPGRRVPGLDHWIDALCNAGAGASTDGPSAATPSDFVAVVARLPGI
jgi:predicted HD phosphohydrolase